MRLWSIHPKYLDQKGLVALWREGLLAQKVIAGETQGYKNHPQLNRFKESSSPFINIGDYLVEVYKEADNRGYKFNAGKIRCFTGRTEQIEVTKGQMLYEFEHLLAKLKVRDYEKFEEIQGYVIFKPNPLFKVIDGEIEKWECIQTH